MHVRDERPKQMNSRMCMTMDLNGCGCAAMNSNERRSGELDCAVSD